MCAYVVYIYMCVCGGGGGGGGAQGLEFGFPCFFSIGMAYTDKQFDIAMHAQL